MSGFFESQAAEQKGLFPLRRGRWLLERPPGGRSAASRGGISDSDSHSKGIREGQRGPAGSRGRAGRCCPLPTLAATSELWKPLPGVSGSARGGGGPGLAWWL